MASLLEIATVARQVDVRGLKIDVYGVSAQGIVELMVRFPEVGKAFSGVEPDTAALMKLAPQALAAFIAAGCGQPGSVELEEVAAKLGVGEQTELVEEIVRLTFPRGIGPFVESLKKLGVLAQMEDVSHPPPSPSPNPSKS